MTRLAIIYGFSTALSRGCVFLYTPILVGSLGLAQFGLFTLVQLGSQLLMPLLCLNGAMAVMREGSDSAERCLYVFRRFLQITVILSFLATTIAATIDWSEQSWVTLSLMLAAMEATHILELTWLRCGDRAGQYLTFAASKAGVTIALAVAARHYGWSLHQVVVGQVAVYGVLASLFVGRTLVASSRVEPAPVPLWPMLKYALPMIPHVMAGWVTRASGQFVIKWTIDDAAVGLFSVACALASAVMLVNSSVSLVLPQIVFRDYDRWKQPGNRRRLFVIYSSTAAAALVLALAALEFDHRFLHLVGTYDASIPANAAIVAAALYLHGFYFIYATYYFYHRRTDALATRTIAAAVINVPLTLAMVSWLGLSGAAMAMLVTFGLYLASVIHGLHAIEPSILKTSRSDLRIAPAGLLVILSAGYLQFRLWS